MRKWLYKGDKSKLCANDTEISNNKKNGWKETPDAKLHSSTEELRKPSDIVDEMTKDQVIEALEHLNSTREVTQQIIYNKRDQKEVLANTLKKNI